MYPILGNRYRCKDCVEVIGFDLCNDCYTTRSKLPGKFNQQHTPEHRFEFVGPDYRRGVISRLSRGEVENFRRARIIPENNVENPENVIAPAINIEESGENELASLLTSTSNLEEQSSEQSPTM